MGEEKQGLSAGQLRIEGVGAEKEFVPEEKPDNVGYTGASGLDPNSYVGVSGVCFSGRMGAAPKQWPEPLASRVDATTEVRFSPTYSNCLLGQKDEVKGYGLDKKVLHVRVGDDVTPAGPQDISNMENLLRWKLEGIDCKLIVTGHKVDITFVR